MNSISNILLILGSRLERTRAFESAVALAQASGATLHLRLFTFDQEIETSGELVGEDTMELARIRHLVDRREWLGAQANALMRKGVRISYDTKWTSRLVNSILGAIRDTGADLVIKDRHRDSALSKLAHGSTDIGLLRRARTPVLLVQPSTHLLPTQIAVAVDAPLGAPEMTPFNRLLISQAVLLTSLCRASLYVARVEPYSESLEQEWKLTRPDHDAVTRFCELSAIDSGRQYVLHGRPDVAIAGFASHADIDLLVLGSCKENAIDRFVLGSTSESILERAPCDVLVIKPERRTTSHGERSSITERRANINRSIPPAASSTHIHTEVPA